MEKNTYTRPPHEKLSYKPPLSPQVKTRVDAIIKQLIDRHAGETVIYASHSGNRGGSDLCKVHLKGGSITSIEPDDLVNPNAPREDADLSEEHLMKARIRGVPAQQNYSYPYWLKSPTRLLYPMKRIGERGDLRGRFVRISWDEALDTIANKIKKVKKKYGPYSIFSGIRYSPNPVMPYFSCGVTGFGNPSSGSQDISGKFCLGTEKVGSHELPDLFNSNLFVFWGCDATTANPSKGTSSLTYYIKLAEERGIPSIVIDSRYSMAAEMLADQWIPIRPTTDIAMILAVVNILFKEDLYDKTYVEKYVEPTGFTKWKDYVLGKTAGPDGAIDRTPGWAEKITGVPAETIKEFARLYAKSKPVNLEMGYGPGRTYRGWKTATGCVLLQTMTGNVGISGGNPSQHFLSFGSIPKPNVDPLFRRKPPTYKSPNTHIEYLWYDVVLLREKYDKGEITKEEYYAAIGNNINNPAPNLKFAFDIFQNKRPNIKKQIEAVKKMEMVVAQRWNWDVDAKAADIVLPLTEHFEETVFVDVNRGFVYTPKLVEPPDEVRPKEWINVQLAKRLGVADKYNPRMKDVPWEQWDVEIQKVCKEAYKVWAKREGVKAQIGTPPTWKEFLKKPVIRIDSSPSIPWQSQIEKGEKFPTSSGKIEFYNSFLETWDPSKTDPVWGGTGIGGPMLPMVMYEVPEEGFINAKC